MAAGPGSLAARTWSDSCGPAGVHRRCHLPLLSLTVASRPGAMCRVGTGGPGSSRPVSPAAPLPAPTCPGCCWRGRGRWARAAPSSWGPRDERTQRGGLEWVASVLDWFPPSSWRDVSTPQTTLSHQQPSLGRGSGTHRSFFWKQMSNTMNRTKMSPRVRKRNWISVSSGKQDRVTGNCSGHCQLCCAMRPGQDQGLRVPSHFPPAPGGCTPHPALWSPGSGWCHWCRRRPWMP